MQDHAKAFPDLQEGKALYIQVADALREYIRDNQLKPGDRIPSQNVLMRRYGVSQSTVRQALLSLSNRGLIVAHQGKGVFVSQPRTRIDIGRPQVHVKSGINAGGFSYEFLGAELLFAPERVASLLAIDNSSQITRCRRKIWIGTQLVGMETANFPLHVVQSFSEDQLHRQDYVTVLAGSPETRVESIDLTVSAGSISDFDSELLDANRDAVVLQRIEVYRNAERRPVVMTRTILLADRVEMSGHVSMNGPG